MRAATGNLGSLAVDFWQPAPGDNPFNTFLAAHGDGMMDLYEALSKYVREEEAKTAEDSEEKHVILAVVGRPNAGKSTLINELIGEERMLTGPEPGLTRDAIPISWEYHGTPVRLAELPTQHAVLHRLRQREE